MKKKKYVAPEVSVIEMEPLQIMNASGWTPDDNKSNGFDIVEEEENGDYEF